MTGLIVILVWWLGGLISFGYMLWRTEKPTEKLDTIDYYGLASILSLFWVFSLPAVMIIDFVEWLKKEK